ncbi:MAG: alkaline phosphatase family protein [Candidatus Eiseniibacteriota bacterium]|jgi:hypothetical protein
MQDGQRVILVFVDGLGLGAADAAVNPLLAPELEILGLWGAPEIERHRPLPHDGCAVAADASLGMPGLPQSATGQTTLFTGTNAARVAGRHVFGFPTRELRDLIARRSLLRRVVERGGQATFLNAFRPRFFELGEAVWERRLSVTTWTNRAAGLPFRSFDDLCAGHAVYQDVTHDSASSAGFDLPRRTPEQAGEILAGVAASHHLTLFEFFQTDRAGHAQDRAWADRELRKLDRMLVSALAAIDGTTTTLVLCSDHGNIEDLSVKTHTANAVPMVLFGRDAHRAAAGLDRLEALTPVVLELLGENAA